MCQNALILISLQGRNRKIVSFVFLVQTKKLLEPFWFLLTFSHTSASSTFCGRIVNSYFFLLLCGSRITNGNWSGNLQNRITALYSKGQIKILSRLAEEICYFSLLFYFSLQKKTNSFVRFLGDSTTHQSAASSI